MKNEIFNALKEVIKSKGLSYKDLAAKMEMSESGFKKVMANKDCSMSKLDEICDILNISISDIVAITNTKKRSLVINEKQERLFLKNPSYYHFFTELMANDYDWEKVREIHRLTKKKCLLILIELDKIDLIRLEPGNKVKKIADWVDISISARLGELVTWEIDEAFFHHARKEFKSKKRTSYGTRGRYYLKKESLAELIKSMSDITDEFAKRSKREEIIHDKKHLLEVTHMSFLAQGFNSSNYIKFK